MNQLNAGWQCEYPLAAGRACEEYAIRCVLGRTTGQMSLFAAVCEDHVGAAITEMRPLRQEVTTRAIEGLYYLKPRPKD
jgi:hypothetical protein